MTAGPRRMLRVLPAVAAVFAFVGSVLILGGAGAQTGGSGPTTTTGSGSNRSSTTTTPEATPKPRPGRIAYVTLAGELVIASSDGSSPKVMGTGAVANKAGLAPIAWSTDDARIAYVRNDRKLAIITISDGSVAEIDDNVVVPPSADENIIGFDITGKFIVYVSEVSPGRYAAKSADYTQGATPILRQLTDPAARTIQSVRFSPVDPILYVQSTDVETGKEFTIAGLNPVEGTIVSGPISLEDPIISPDGATAYGVFKNQSGGGIDQLVRVDIVGLQVTPIADHDRVCMPAANYTSNKVVFAAGENCNEVWIIDGDGQNERKLGDDFSGNSFQGGNFSWSLDDEVVSHAACKSIGTTVICGGGYWDIRTDGNGALQRAQAGSVMRETRPFLRALKLNIEMTGPLEYKSKMILASNTSPNLLALPAGQIVEADGADENDRGRTISLKAYHPTDEPFITGTLHIVDGKDFDHTVMFMARVQLASYGYATMRAVWIDSSSFPVKSGRVDISIYR